MKYIQTDKSPEPAGHYSQAVVSGDLVFVSGQLPIDPASGEVGSSFDTQTKQVLDNVENIPVDGSRCRIGILTPKRNTRLHPAFPTIAIFHI
jgi:2-iminobutanoate/2-iminopropanoate deaminase